MPLFKIMGNKLSSIKEDPFKLICRWTIQYMPDWADPLV